jgi:hypothetical protein
MTVTATNRDGLGLVAAASLEMKFAEGEPGVAPLVSELTLLVSTSKPLIA